MRSCASQALSTQEEGRVSQAPALLWLPVGSVWKRGSVFGEAQERSGTQADRIEMAGKVFSALKDDVGVDV